MLYRIVLSGKHGSVSGLREVWVDAVTPDGAWLAVKARHQTVKIEDVVEIKTGLSPKQVAAAMSHDWVGPSLLKAAADGVSGSADRWVHAMTARSYRLKARDVGQATGCGG